MIIREIHISAEMIAAGIEAMQEAKTLCFEDGDLVIEVYLAMLGKSYFEPEVVH